MKTTLCIVDDDTIYRLIITKMVNHIDPSVDVLSCEHGKSGMACVERLKNSRDRVVVLLDINMPVLDGWGFLDEMEKCSFYGLPLIEICLVSSSTDESDIVKSREYTCLKGFLHKPLTSDDIRAILSADGTRM